jgi:hypothetical protein
VFVVGFSILYLKKVLGSWFDALAIFVIPKYWYPNPKIEPSKPQTHNQNQKNAPHSNPAFSKTQVFSLNLTKQV